MHTNRESDMSRLDRLAALGLVLALLGPLGAASADAPRPLAVYTWSEYIDPALVAEFEAEFDVDVEFSYFDSDEMRDKELTARGGTGFDVVVVNGAQMGRYVKRGWVAPLDESNVANLAHVDPRWRGAFDGAADGHGVPYFWGTLGIAWRGDLHPEGVPSWRALLEPEPGLHGRIMMSGYGRELVGFALKADGHSINTTDRELIRAAGRRLARQKPHVRSYGYPSLTEESSLLSGDVWAAPMYSGDALMLRELEPEIVYAIPAEGGLLWVDYLSVASTSVRKPLARAFIDFLNRPAVAARNAEYVFYATPNLAARELMSDDYLADPVIHPSEVELDALESFRPLPARSTKSLNTVISELRAD